MLNLAHKREVNQLFIFLALITLARLLWLPISGHELYGDEAQYWLWSLSPSFGYYSKPPIVAWAIHLSTSILGDSEWAIRFLSPIVHAIVTFIIFKIAEKLLDRTTAFWSAVTYATLPAVFLSSSLISTDPFLMLFWALALYSFILAYPKNNLFWWTMVGVFCGLGMLSKYSMGLFLLGIFIHLYFEGKLLTTLKSYKIWFGGLIAFLIWLPNLVWNFENAMASFNHTYDLAKGRGDAAISLKNFLVFFISQFAVFGPILFSTLIYILLQVKRAESKKQNLLLVFFAVFFTTICLISIFSRAHANWAAPAYIAATILVVNFLISAKLTKVLKASFVLHIVLGSIFMSYAVVIQNTNIKLSKETDAFRRLRGFKELGKQLEPYRKHFPYAMWATDNRMSLSLFAYYTHPHMLGIRKWNPANQIKDHFDLKTTLDDARGKDLIIISDYYNDSAPFVKYGMSSSIIGVLYYSPYKGLERKYNLILIKNFGGYQ